MLLCAAVVVCGAVMTILDSTIVNVAIERLAVVFDARLSTIQWVSTAYLLALAAVIPLAGWAVDRFGTRRVFMAAVAAFAAGSLLCGLAWSAGSLIAFRVAAGARRRAGDAGRHDDPRPRRRARTGWGG